MLIAGIAFATAVFAFDDAVCIVPIDKTGATPTPTTYVPTPSYGRDVIYDEQTWDDFYCTNGLSIYGAAGYEPADDFVPYDDVTVNEIVIWLSGQEIDLRVDWFADSDGPADAPPADFFNEEVASADITWEDTGDTAFGYPVIKCTIPTGDVELTGNTKYWLGVQNTTGPATYWWAFTYGTMGGPYWDHIYFYYVSYWTHSSWPPYYELFYELHGWTGPPDEEAPTVTDMYPLDEDFPSGVPPNENTAGCHWQDGDPDTNRGIDVDASYFEVYDAGMDLVTGMLDIDDSDLWDVVVDFEGDDPWEEGATYTVETETYDLAGNGPVTEEWSFTTGYVNIAPASLGIIKVGFTE
jgi:hypothetical protein